MIVKLQDIADKLEEIDDEWIGFLNIDTGEISMIGRRYMAIAEDSEENDDFSGYQDWERGFIEEAMNILKDFDLYEKLPDKFDIDEYHIMEDFSCTYGNEAVSQRLCSAIHGRGAFRRFKDMVVRLGIEEKWYACREKALINIVREWCEHKKIRYEI